MKRERVSEERQGDGLAVLGVDHDLPRRGAAHDAHLLRFRGEADVLRRRLDAAPDGAGGELGLRLELVEQAVIPEEDRGDVNPVIQRRHDHEQREQTPERARAAAALGDGRAPHHCDWAPSTRSFTSFWSASLRPSASCGGWYSPTSVSPWRCHSVLPWR